MPARAPDFQPGQVLPGTKYTVVRELGAGGMGVVYHVVKPPEIQAVLKLMGLDLAEHQEYRIRFLDEVRVLAKLEHPNIVRVFDYDFLADGTPFYVMEMLSGRTVRDVISVLGRVPPRVAFEITRQLLEALHCAHTNEPSVVHRDIKPENVFLHAPKHGDPVVKLIDFGVVAIADRAHDGTFVGTWKYAAPEQIRGERATPATDLYAVGLMLYEMLAGEGPFDHHETGPRLAEAHVNEIPAPVSVLAPWVPASVVALIESALAKNPAHRPRDAFAFAEQLFELEWAQGGESAHDQTAEGPLPASKRTEPKEAPRAPGPLSRVLSSVTAERPSTKIHHGATLVGVGGEADLTSPGEDALLAGLVGRKDVPHVASLKERVSEPDVGKVVVRPSRPRGVDARTSAETVDAPISGADTFSTHESTTKALAKKSKVPVVPLAIGALCLAAAVVVVVVERRGAVPAGDAKATLAASATAEPSAAPPLPSPGTVAIAPSATAPSAPSASSVPSASASPPSPAASEPPPKSRPKLTPRPPAKPTPPSSGGVPSDLLRHF